MQSRYQLTIFALAGMFGDQGVDFAAMTPQVLALAREVLDEFSASRAWRVKSSPMIVDQVNAIREIVRQVAIRAFLRRSSYYG